MADKISAADILAAEVEANDKLIHGLITMIEAVTESCERQLFKYNTVKPNQYDIGGNDAAQRILHEFTKHTQPIRDWLATS
jgi:hypothetical protein